MPHAFDRRKFLAGGVALGAGLAALGSGTEWAGASLTNGPGRNGISTATPKRGGSITFGMDTEEGGFDPTTARWDEGGFLYGRTVFDPLAIVTSTAQIDPYRAIRSPRILTSPCSPSPCGRGSCSTTAHH